MSTAPIARDGRALASSSVVVGAGTLLSRITGVVRVAVMASVLGSQVLSDTYNAANNTPNIVYELLLGGIITATLVPLFVDASDRSDSDGISAVFTVALTALLAITAAATLAAPWIARLLTSQYAAASRADARSLATLLVRCFMLQIFGYGFAALASALLNARRRYVAAAFAPVVNNVVVVAVLLAIRTSHHHVLTLHATANDRTLALVLGIGTTAGVALTAIVLVAPLVKSGARIHAVFAWRHPLVLRMLRLSGWTIGYVVANQVAAAFVLVVAGKHQVVTAYLYAYVLVQLPHGLLAVSIMTVLGPELAAAAQAGDAPRFGAQLSLGLRYLVSVVAPAAAGYLAISRPAVALLLRHGDFGAAGTRDTAAALVGFAIGLVPLSVYLYTLRGFYARGDTRTPFVINVVENAVNVVLVLAFYSRLGAFGLALAFSLSYVVAAAIAIVVLQRRWHAIERGPVFRLLSSVAPAAAAAGGAAWVCARALDQQAPVVAVAASGAAGVAVYTGVLLALRPPELASLWNTMRRAPRSPGARV